MALSKQTPKAIDKHTNNKHENKHNKHENDKSILESKIKSDDAPETQAFPEFAAFDSVIAQVPVVLSPCYELRISASTICLLPYAALIARGRAFALRGTREWHKNIVQFT